MQRLFKERKVEARQIDLERTSNMSIAINFRSLKYDALPRLSQEEDKGVAECGPVAFAADQLHASFLHDLRNPVTTILAGAELLQSFEIESPQVKRLTANIHEAAKRMRELLADFAKLTSGIRPPAEMCKLSEVVGSASKAALLPADLQRVQISHEIPHEWEMLLERSRMERVFFNLIINAVQAMPHGGKIRIRARKANGSIQIRVEDTGPGIPREIRGRLFEPFVTAGKEDGLGLGLATSRQTVLDHGGDMWAEPASGARLVVSLPLRERTGCSCSAGNNKAPFRNIAACLGLRRHERKTTRLICQCL